MSSLRPRDSRDKLIRFGEFPGFSLDIITCGKRELKSLALASALLHGQRFPERVIASMLCIYTKFAVSRTPL